MSNEKITATQIDTAFVDAQQEKWRAAAAACQEAAAAYMADISARKAVLEQQATEYQTELATMHAARNELAANINDLVSRGKIDEAAEFDTELEALDKSITAMERKLRLVNTTELKGDAELYNAAKAAHEAAEAERTPYRESITNLNQIVSDELKRLEEETKRLESMQSELYYAMSRTPGSSAADAFAKVDRHYRARYYEDLARLGREEAEKAEAERKAAEQEKGSYRRSFF